ncbi:dynein regulatory complex protein 10-like [Vespula squamosa]|uniref:Dynein regulatory complex protein 10 n=1 Tax=Vespula squamosa TaxID=30214 RepID=A0ABD2A097_VESSQ
MNDTMSQFKKQQKKNGLDSILNCIKQIFHETMDTFQLVITVPLLIKNSTLKSLLTKEEMELVNNIVFFTDRMHSDQSHSSESKISQTSYESSTNELKEDIDKNITDTMIFKMLKILYNYPSIRKVVVSCWMKVSGQSLLFKHYIYYFMKYIISIMELTPEEEMAKNMHYKNVWSRNKDGVEEIRKLTTDLEMQREEKEKEMESTMTQYKTDTTIIDKLNEICIEDLQSVSSKYEKKQYLLYKSWEIKRDELYDKLDQVKKEFEMIKTANFKIISDINNKRLKTEAQLLSVINRFDTDIDDKLTEYEELCETYESDKMEKNSLKAAIQFQEDTYDLFLKDVYDESLEYYAG